jgi:tetratricopeptide (TPR) repeat protein/DNA-binding winged helix-turn-helix (wHTH) protein
MARGLQEGFRLGRVEVITDAGELRSESGIAILHPQTMKLLVYLAEHAGELIPAQRLREAVWPSAAVTDETVRRCIKELRHRLRDDAANPTFIEEGADGGYRLIAPVTPSQARASAEEPSPVQRFLGQLKRRKVFRAVAAYTVVGWLLLQVTDVIVEGVPWLPNNSLTILIILLASGFPIVIGLAWWLEITDQGVVLDPETVRRWPQVARIWRPIAFALGLAGAAGVATFLLTREEIWRGERIAAAVLPFEDRSLAGAGNSCGWLTEEITDALTNIRELRVAARTSSESLSAAKLAIPEIAERLRVDYLLEGSCGADSDRLRITAQLVEAEEGFHLWSQVYDVPWSERLKVVREIAKKTAQSLDIDLSDESKRQLGRVPTKSEQAYVSYQQGRGYLGMSRDETHLRIAEKLFRQAIGLDEAFAEAHAGLCETYLALYELERNVLRYDQAEKACAAALDTGEFAAQVYVALGNLYRYSGEYQRANDAFWRAIQLDDTLADAHVGSGRIFALTKRPVEAESSFKRAIDLEPGYWLAYNAYGDFLFKAGRYEEAAEQFGEVVNLTPDNQLGLNNVGAAYFQAGRFGEAARAFEQSLALSPSRDAELNTGTMYFYAGDFAKSAEHYRRGLDLAPEDYRAWGNLGDALHALGDEEASADYREAARRAETALAMNEADALARSDLAHYAARLGQSDRARQLIERAIAEAPGDVGVRYNAGLVFATLREKDQSLDNLARAVDMGYPRELLRVDPGLASLAESPRFAEIAGSRIAGLEDNDNEGREK